MTTNDPWIPEEAYHAFRMYEKHFGRRGHRYKLRDRNKIPKPAVCPTCNERPPTTLAHKVPRRFWWEYGVAEHVLFSDWNVVWVCGPKCNARVELSDTEAFAFLTLHGVKPAPYLFESWSGVA